MKLSENLQVNEPNNKTTGAQESFSQTPKVGLKKEKKRRKRGKMPALVTLRKQLVARESLLLITLTRENTNIKHIA